MLERLGNYQILEMIASGALGTVYRAQDTVSDTVVAIEVIDPSLAGNSDFLEELQVQIELAKLLDRPNITPVQEFAIQDGTSYLVTEYISDSLAQRLASGRRFTWRQSVSIALQASRALEHAHASEISHFDVNPENIRFRPDGSLTVTGFGIALALQRSNVSAPAVVNANYRSPEQWDGGTLDSRSDVYSLGITLYQMLEGNLPFDGDDQAAAEAWHRAGPTPSFTESLQVPKVVTEVIERAIEKSPGSRHESAETMSLALEDILSGRAFDPPESIAARTSPLRPINSPPEMVPVSARPSRSGSKNASRRNLFALAGVAALVVIAIFVGMNVIGFGDDETGVQAAQRSTPTPSDNGSDEPGSEDTTDDPLATVEPNGSQNGTPSSPSGTPEPTEVPDATTVPVPTPSVSLTPDPTATPRPTPTPVFLDEYTQGLIYLSEQDYNNAIVEFNTAIEYDPSVPEVYEARAVAYTKLGEFLPAVEDYAEAIRLNPSKATLYRDRANALTFLGLDRLAILDYQQAVTLDPEIPGGYRGMGQAWARADILSVTEDLTPQGIEAFGQALRLFPNDFEAAKGRALLNMRRGLFDAAIEEFTFLIDANPSDQLDTTYRRGLSFYAIGFNSQAITDANRIISIDLYNSEYYYLRSVIYTSLAESAPSQSDLETSCALNPILTEDQIRLGADSTLEGILPFRSCPLVPADLVPTLEPSP